MPKQICAFWENEPDVDGWVKVTQMHHKPDILDENIKSNGVLGILTRPPEVKSGWDAALYANVNTHTLEWRIEMDKNYRMSAAEFLLQLPIAARINARQAAATGDLVMQDFIDMIDRMIADNASMGIHPGSYTAKVALDYIVQQGWMTQEEADAITEG
jgi:hypothetical protein